LRRAGGGRGEGEDGVWTCSRWPSSVPGSRQAVGCSPVRVIPTSRWTAAVGGSHRLVRSRRDVGEHACGYDTATGCWGCPAAPNSRATSIDRS